MCQREVTDNLQTIEDDDVKTESEEYVVEDVTEDGSTNETRSNGSEEAK